MTRHDPKDIALVGAAYMSLLALPQGYTRLTLQPVLACLRHELAVLQGREDEEVQKDYEDRVFARSMLEGQGPEMTVEQIEAMEKLP